MSYPAQSNARNGIADSLWWFATFDSLQHICQSQVGTVISDLQRVLRANLPRTYVLNGVLWDRDQITVDGNFGPKTFAGLVRMLEDLDVPSGERESILQDYARCVSADRAATGAAGTAVRWDTMNAAIHVAEHRLLPWTATLFPRDGVTMLFSIDSAPEGDARGNVHCDLQSAADRPVPEVNIDVEPNAPSDGGDNALILVGLVAALALASAGKKRKR